METEVGLGTPVTIVNDTTIIGGIVDGMKLGRNGLERISIEKIDHWFWMSDGWEFLVDEEDEADGSIQPE